MTPTRELAWLVGYAECGPDTWFFALNVEGERVWDQWGCARCPPGAGAGAARRNGIVVIVAAPIIGALPSADSCQA